MKLITVAFCSLVMLTLSNNVMAQTSEDTLITSKVHFGMNFGFSSFSHKVNYNIGEHMTNQQTMNLGIIGHVNLNKNITFRVGTSVNLPTELIYQNYLNGKIIDSKTNLYNSLPNQVLNILSPNLIQLPINLIYGFPIKENYSNYILVGYNPTYNLSSKGRALISKNKLEHIIEFGFGHRFRSKYVFIIPEFKYGLGSNLYLSNMSNDIQVSSIRNRYLTFTLHLESNGMVKKKILYRAKNTPLYKRPEFLVTTLLISSLLLIN
jgi:hypothetical protein